MLLTKDSPQSTLRKTIFNRRDELCVESWERFQGEPNDDINIISVRILLDNLEGYRISSKLEFLERHEHGAAAPRLSHHLDHLRCWCCWFLSPPCFLALSFHLFLIHELLLRSGGKQSGIFLLVASLFASAEKRPLLVPVSEGVKFFSTYTHINRARN